MEKLHEIFTNNHAFRQVSKDIIVIVKVARKEQAIDTCQTFPLLREYENFT